ncbi:hypothetical protein ANO11243_003660 [Dothideomycetidae sp. 11243]|nr:hypothetical protein ANO11243_003660 [fungal sp. No.11243]
MDATSYTMASMLNTHNFFERQKVVLGPNGSYFACSGNHAWWNLRGVSKDTKDEVEAVFQKMKNGQTQYSFFGITSFVMGLRGELAMVWDMHTNMVWSDIPPLETGFVQAFTDIMRNGRVMTLAFGPGNTGIVQPVGRSLPSYWSPFHVWPSPELRSILTTINGLRPVAHIECSVVNHRYYYVVRNDGSSLNYNFEGPAEAKTKLAEWFREYAVSARSKKQNNNNTTCNSRTDVSLRQGRGASIWTQGRGP